MDQNMVDSQRLLKKLTGLAPYAALVLLDERASQSWCHLYILSVRAGDERVHPLVQATVAASPALPDARAAMLHAQPELVKRSLAALGVSFAKAPDGPAGRAEFLAMFRELLPHQVEALLEVDRLLDEGAEVALEGGDPFDFNPLDELPEELLEPLAHGPVAAFLLLSAAAGDSTPGATAAFPNALGSTTSTLLRDVFLITPSSMGARVERLLADSAFLTASLQALTQVFLTVEGGDEARDELLRVLRVVCETDPRYAAVSEVVERLSRLFTGAEEVPVMLLGNHSPEEREAIADGPIAAFLHVTGPALPAPAPTKTFFDGYVATTDPLLAQVQLSAPGSLADRFQLLVGADARMDAGLTALGQVFRTLADGEAAKEALLGLLGEIAGTAEEKGRVDALRARFERGEPQPVRKAAAPVPGLTADITHALVEGLAAAVVYACFGAHVVKAPDLGTFLQGIVDSPNPTLQAIYPDFSQSLAMRTALMVNNAARCDEALASLASALDGLPSGRDTREEVMRLVVELAVSPGPLTGPEKDALSVLLRQLCGGVGGRLSF